ncbi:MAG: hypothetical protein DRP64_20410 [Verrucomicrobia bacterium]|nr:MAG: hypothetical protein DRP64_20410 [Verrucomicrobiota bacterium]
MKTIISALLILFSAGGSQAIAESIPPSAENGDEVSNQPLVEETTMPNKKTSAPKSQKNIRDNIFYGGYINLSFGSYTVIGIEPMVGYKLTPKLSTGVKVRYDYIKDDRYAKSHTTSTYGGSIFGRYLLTPKFYAQAEAASYNYESFHPSGGSEREWVPFLLMGGGFIQPLGERTWLNIEILFDVLQDEKSPYDDWEPFFSIGIGAGF